MTARITTYARISHFLTARRYSSRATGFYSPTQARRRARQLRREGYRVTIELY